MKRRTFVGALALGVLGASRAARGQAPSRVVRIGWLSGGSPTTFATRMAAFRRGLVDLGYSESNVFIEQRWAEGKEELLPGLAAELVQLRVAVLVSVGTPATLAARQATDVIPVVMVAVGDPVGSGIVGSLARPWGNITGISNLAAELSGKLLDLLREAVPGLARVAVLENPTNSVHAAYWRETQVVGEKLGMKMVAVEVRKPEDIEGAFASISRQQAGAVLVLPDPLHLIHRVRIAELAVRHHLPTMSPTRDYVDAGCLLSYGPSTPDLYRRAAAYVDKILRGARPADLPVEQPTKFELVVNLKTAKALGLNIPTSLLIRADQVVQ